MLYGKAWAVSGNNVCNKLQNSGNTLVTKHQTVTDNMHSEQHVDNCRTHKLNAISMYL